MVRYFCVLIHVLDNSFQVAFWSPAYTNTVGVPSPIWRGSVEAQIRVRSERHCRVGAQRLGGGGDGGGGAYEPQPLGLLPAERATEGQFPGGAAICQSQLSLMHRERLHL